MGGDFHQLYWVLTNWLEYIDWCNIIVAEPLRIERGMAVPRAAAGAGVDWNVEGIKRSLACGVPGLPTSAP